MNDRSPLALFRERRDIFNLACRFNSRPALDLHPDHVAGQLSPELLLRLRRSHRAIRRLSRWMHSKFQLDESGYWDFFEERSRLALLCWPSLDRLALALGTTIYCDKIAAIISSEEQRQLRREIGDDLYLYAVKRAPFMVNDNQKKLAVSSPTEWRGQLRESGRRCIAHCLRDQPPNLMRRLELKLPAGFLSQAPTIEHQVTEIWNLVKRVLLSVVEPELVPCFN